MRLVLYSVVGEEGMHLSPSAVLERLTQGYAELGSTLPGFAGKIVVTIGVPVDHAEQVEEAAARAGLEFERGDEVDDDELEAPE